MGPAPSKAEREYQAEDDHRTLTRAAEVQGNSTRMAGVKQHHRKQQKALATVGRTLKGKR